MPTNIQNKIAVVLAILKYYYFICHDLSAIRNYMYNSNTIIITIITTGIDIGGK
jgi:hypothetical protein